jgi:glycine oxidase
VLRFEGGYLVPRGDGAYVLGATMEERGFDTTVTAGGLYELLRDAHELVPGLSELVVEAAIAGLRPGTPDNLPLVEERDGVLLATGHGRNGVLLAPLTAEMVVHVLGGMPAPAQLAREREGGPPMGSLAELLAACDPARFAPAASRSSDAMAGRAVGALP